jgi:hypothetical protein
MPTESKTLTEQRHAQRRSGAVAADLPRILGEPATAATVEDGLFKEAHTHESNKGRDQRA